MNTMRRTCFHWRLPKFIHDITPKKKQIKYSSVVSDVMLQVGNLSCSTAVASNEMILTGSGFDGLSCNLQNGMNSVT